VENLSVEHLLPFEAQIGVIISDVSFFILLFFYFLPAQLTLSHCSRSHSTTPLLFPPTPPSFTLDFAQVFQATAASPARAARIRPGRSAPGVGLGRMRRERIMEEEDGWDIVEFGGTEEFG
jgi:hypothetical protein